MCAHHTHITPFSRVLMLGVVGTFDKIIPSLVPIVLRETVRRRVRTHVVASSDRNEARVCPFASVKYCVMPAVGAFNQIGT